MTSPLLRFQRMTLTAAACLLAGIAGFAQGPGAPPASPPPVNASNDPLLGGFTFRSIGPATMAGGSMTLKASSTIP